VAGAPIRESRSGAASTPCVVASAQTAARASHLIPLWSRRRTLFGADAVADRDDSILTPGVDAARIRAFFVHPDAARRGVGAAILSACEAAATQAGFTALELGATLTGLPFYRRYGYEPVERRDAPLPGGDSLAIVAMRKVMGARG